MSSTTHRTPVAVIGAGFIAEFHLAILDQIRNVEVVAIVDADLRRAEAMARRFSCSNWFGSIAEMAKVVKPEVAHLLVPPPVHAAAAQQLLQLGIGVFVEKPLATDLAECEELVRLARDRELPLSVNHNNVFHPSFQKLKQMLDAGSLGRLQHLFVCLHVPLRQLDAGDFRHWMFQEPGNIVFEQGPHPFSQVYELLGRPRVMNTMRSGKREPGPGLTFYDTWQISLQCEKGPATVLLSFGKDFAENWIRAIGQDGAVQIDLLRRHSLHYFKTPWMDFYDQFKISLKNSLRWFGQGLGNAANYVLSTAKLKGRTDVFYLGMKTSVEEFYRALQRRDPLPLAAATHGLDVIRMCEMATQDLVAGPPLEPLEPPETDAKTDLLITGATGFLGRYLVKRLKNENQRLRLLVRQPRLVPEELLGEDISLVPGELENLDSLKQAVKGVHTVVHLATGGGDTWEEVERSMVGGCRGLAEACLEAGVPHLVFTSTIATLYLGRAGDPAVTEQTETDPKPAGRSLYARGKIACEQLLREVQAGGKLSVTILRPGVVVGEGGPVQHSGVGLWTRDSQCFGWGLGNHDLPFVLAADVADALWKVTERGPNNGLYNLVGDARMTAREWVETLRRRTGRDFQFHGQPLFWFQCIEICKWLVKVAIRRPNATFPSYRDLKTRALVRPFDNSLPKQELGWQPVEDLQKFIELAMGWYIDRGLGLEPEAETNVAKSVALAREELWAESGIGPVS